jgi:hypothetical protein
LELEQDHGGTPEERVAIGNAIQGLNALTQDAGLLYATEKRSILKAKWNWSELYKVAVLETDNDKLPDRIREAKTAIDRRLETLQADHGGTPEERSAMGRALARLLVLRTERDSGRAHAPDPLCRVCQEPAAFEECKVDENGKVVHERCYVRELLQNASDGQDQENSRQSPRI